MNHPFSWKLPGMILLCLALIVSCAGPQPQSTPTAPAVETLSVQVEAGQVGPHVIAQTPVQGQRLDLGAAIQIQFDRDMDTAQTGASFALLDPDEAPVPGKLTWLDARSLSFQPDKPLQPATAYTALIENAAGQDGSAAQEAIRLEFKTVESLGVAQVFPEPEAEEIDPDSSITVIFNRPVVPVVVAEEQANLPQPLEFSPAVSGTGEWLNSSVYVFQPEKPLLSGSRYTVQVDASLADSAGNRLEEPYLWQFTTRAPLIGSYGLTDGAWNPKGKVTNVLLDQVFAVNFLQPMDPASVAKAVAIYDRETGQAFPIRLKWRDKDFTSLRIEPVGRFELAGFYRLTVEDSAQAQDGGRLKQGLSLPFDTIGPPRILHVYPNQDTDLKEYQNCFGVDFASPMKANTIESRVKVSPEPKNKLQIYYYDYGYHLSVCGLEPDTDYVVRLLPGMTDRYGNAIQTEYAFTFKNPDYAPYARLALPWTPLVYRAKGPQEVFFEHLNLDSAQISLYSISEVEFSRLLKGDFPTSDFHPQNRPLRTWQPEVTLERNRLHYLNLTLEDPKGNPLPPGYYFLGLQAAPLEYDSAYYQGFLFIVATDNLTLKATPGEALAWVINLESGKPQAGVPVAFYNDKFIYLGQAFTGADGVARLNANTPTYARVEGDEHLGFTALDWGSGVWTGQFGISENYYENRPTSFAYIYTDRPLYRPGQEVFFKGILRKDDDLHYSLPASDSVYVTVDHWGEQIYAKELPLSDLGGFYDSFTLAESAALGAYDIYVRYSAGGETFGHLSFRVAEYHKPEFQVSVAATPAQALASEKVQFDLQAAYYAGGNVADAQVEWFIESRPYTFVPAREYRGFNFIAPRGSASPQTPAASSLPTEGQGLTDQNGQLIVTFPPLAKTAPQAQQVTFKANVTDVGGNLVSGSGSVVLHPSQVYAGIRAQKFIGAAGEAQTFEVVALDWDSQPLAGQEVSVQFVERKWYSVQEKDKQGQLRWVTSVKEIPVDTQKVVTDEQGLATVSFTPSNGGTFEARVTVRDKKGNTYQASTYVWVTSQEAIAWQQTNDRTFDVVADQASYQVGETAKILLAQPFNHPVYALVTVERGHIYHQEVLLLKDNSTIYELPITAEMAPILYVSAVVVSGAQEDESPDFKVGMTRLEVDTSQQTLQVNVTADQETSGPGRSVTYTITAKDAAGKPVQAEASLAVVDKAALALAPSNVMPILNSFYPQRALGVRTALGLVSNADNYNAQYRKNIPEGGGSGGGGGGESLGIVTVRQDFKDTAAFEALVMTDENGQAQVTVELPENLTTWQAEARAVTADSKVGQATNEVLSTKPLFVELTTPRFFVVGDQAQVGAIVHNTTASALEVEVNLEAEGAALDNGSSQKVQVEAKGQAYVVWDLTVQDVQRVDLTVHASGGGYQDASKPALGTLEGQGIPVYRFNVQETVGTAGMLGQAGSVTESLQLPRTLDYSDASLSIRVEPSLAASLQSGLKYLEDFDYLCIEQTVSRFLPNVITARALKAAGMQTSRLKSDLDRQANAALQRIYAKQLYDGGWNWWDGGESDPYVTAYVVYGLLEARDSGYTVAEDALAAGLRFLKEGLPDIASDIGKHGKGSQDDRLTSEYNRYAFMMYVLARGGELGAGDPNGLYEQRAILSLYARAYLMQTLYLLDPDDGRIAALLSDLGSATVMSASGAHWEEAETDYWNWNTDTRTTAIILNAFVQVDPANPILPQVIRWLMTQRRAAHWASTQETTWSLIALTNWLAESKEFDTHYQYAVGLNGESLAQRSVSRDNLTETLNLQVELKDLLKDEANYLVFTRGEGMGNLYYSAYLSATLPVEQVQPLDRGVSLTREYFTLDDPKTPITEIERGELVRVRLTLVVPAALHYVVVEDPLPAGFEAVDASLLTGVEAPRKYTVADYQRLGWGWWYFTHQEVRDEKVVLSTDYLPAGTYVYTYLARASTAGTFKVIPPTASEFYFPDVGGRGAGSVFVVRP
ncbi:MAG: alpha-2-macroglobulin family protein [Anaerolineales bacterium]